MRYPWVCLALCAVSLVARADERDINKTVAADPHGTVEISNVSGEIDVTGWDSPQVEVRGTLGAGADRLDVESEGGRTSIKVIVPNHSFRSADTDLRIRVPRESELDISTVSAHISMKSVQGALSLKTVNGDVNSDLYQHDAEIKTVSGSVALQGRAEVSAPGSHIRITSVSGDITIQKGAGDLEATTVSGNMRIQLDPTHNVRIRTTSGQLTFNGKLTRGGNLDSETISGSVNIHAAAESGMEYDISSFSGDISDCMGVQAEKVSKYGPGKRLSGSDGVRGGEDAARVRIKTMSGDVQLCDKAR